MVCRRAISLVCSIALRSSRSSSSAREVRYWVYVPLYSTTMTDGVLGRPIEVQHARDRFVEQFEVVADDEQRAAVLAHEVEQPLLGVDVEVVGGLVEQQHVAAGEQRATRRAKKCTKKKRRIAYRSNYASKEKVFIHSSEPCLLWCCNCTRIIRTDFWRTSVQSIVN